MTHMLGAYASAPPPQGSPRHGAERYALVVADNAEDRALVQRSLREAGFVIDLVSSAEEALALIARREPDLVCCDVGLPGDDGYLLGSTIRARYPDAHVPIIFISASSDERALLKCFDHGADDVMVKPVNAARLRAKVVAALRTRELHQVLSRQRDQLARYQTDMRRDMEIAKSIMDNLGSEKTLALPNVSYHLQPMDTLNGDLIIGGRSPGGAQCFLFGDFTGHGLPAAIGVQVVHGVFCAMVARGHAIDRIATELNRKVRELLPRDRFLSAALIEIYPDSGTISVWNGGMPELLVHNAAGEALKGFRSSKLPLGVLPVDEFDASLTRRQLREGDALFCYSDGVIEALDAGGAMFGVERVKLALANADAQVVERVRSALLRHTGGTPQQDDVSMLHVRFERDAMLALADRDAPMETTRAATHWRCSVELGHDALRSTDPVPVLGAVMDAVQGFGRRRDEIYMVVSALFARALEQGLLGLDPATKTDQSGFARYYHALEEALAALDEGYIAIAFSHTPDADGGVLEIEVRESRTAASDAPGVRSVPLANLEVVRSLCESLRFSADGRVAVARYRWYKNGAR